MAKFESNDDNDDQNQKPEVSEQGRAQPSREKEVSRTQQSSSEPTVEKEVSRQRRAEVQNPLMHESY